MNQAVTQLPYPTLIVGEANTSESATCPLCAVNGALVAMLLLAVLAKAVFLPHGPVPLKLDPSCRLDRGACSMALPDGGRIEFALAPRPIHLLSPLQLEIRVSGSAVHPLEVDFSGVSTPMAFNRAYLIHAADGVYSAQTSLPICATGRMTWQATVLLQAGERQILAPFRFETER